MKIVIFGSTATALNSAHADVWCALLKAMLKRGHYAVFFEANPLLEREPPPGEFVGYSDWENTIPCAKQHLQDCDVAIVSSKCRDAIAATELVGCSRARVRCFYDLDAPETLTRWKSGQEVDYIGTRGLRDFDLVLSSAGGRALLEMRRVLAAKRVAPLFACVDPGVFTRPKSLRCHRHDLLLLGDHDPAALPSYSELFLGAAALAGKKHFVCGGEGFAVSLPNVEVLEAPMPNGRPSLLAAARASLVLAPRFSGAYGFCPPPSIFQIAACGVPILTEYWEGLEYFFVPSDEVTVVHNRDEVVSALDLTQPELKRMAEAARDRVLEEHTATRRIVEFEAALSLTPGAGAVHHPHVDIHSTLEIAGLE